MELITTKNFIGNDVNDLTKEMDKHVISPYKNFETYMYRLTPTHIAIRYPGATRGHIIVDDDNIIQDITLYNTATNTVKSVGCYNDSVINAVKQFIGCKIIF